MDIKEAMKIVAYNVIVNGNEQIELALQTVEKELGLEPVISHGNGESFHYKDQRNCLIYPPPTGGIYPRKENSMTEQHVDPVMAAEYCTTRYEMAECMAICFRRTLRSFMDCLISDHEKEYGVKERTNENGVDM